MTHIESHEAIAIYRSTKNQREFAQRCGFHGIKYNDAAWLWEVIDAAFDAAESEEEETE
jgi:hypothetical protein